MDRQLRKKPAPSCVCVHSELPRDTIPTHTNGMMNNTGLPKKQRQGFKKNMLRNLQSSALERDVFGTFDNTLWQRSRSFLLNAVHDVWRNRRTADEAERGREGERESWELLRVWHSPMLPPVCSLTGKEGLDMTVKNAVPILSGILHFSVGL